MRILYRFHGWLIFVRVTCIALFMFVWPYVRPHILCTHLVICLLSHFIHIWYLGWPWSYIIFHHSKRLLANCPGRIHISWFQHSLHSFMPLHHVKSHYNLILYYTSTYVERVGVSQHDNVCSFILYVIPGLKIIFIILKVFCKWRRRRPINWTLHGIHACHRNFSKMNKPNKCSIN